MIGTRANEKLYWNHRAGSYPRPFEPETLARTEKILRLLERAGVEFENRRVIDIGCGTGVYGLPLADRAASVLCVDSSRAMLAILRKERREHGISNVFCRLSSWADLPAACSAGRFDIALASMTMAVKRKSDLVKMEQAARERCVYIGWAGTRRNALMERIYRAHGLKYGAPPGAEAVVPALRGMGRRFTLSFMRDSFKKTASIPSMLREIGLSMHVNGVKLRKEWVQDMLKDRAVDGKVEQTTRVRKAVITWKPHDSR